ncbi:class II aldolase/adducin family protein [Niallia sp. FSL W8-0635]|uniref:class II aldolase/adducin family protein n=1 Tax=Niallia sp. FSL W8-0635 TaxID=2975337 RepID=UPI0009C6924B|nr:ribulose-5-phosphate 4-epimerase-like epimerase or aldolase [Mycobacteroides abscessus subsp. abscessus]HEO8419658.1 class II aldolase/adducin family protein [Yersinia enterocolitica]
MNRLELIKELQQTGSFMMNNQLAWGTAGNISARLDNNDFYVSASGTYLGELEYDDFSLCSTDGLVEGKKPSKEFKMHQGIYEQRPEINAVLHASPFYSTLIACSDIDLPNNYFVEAMYYLEKVVRIPYKHPGSVDLAEVVTEHAKEGNVMLLENHGVIVYDVSLKEARMALQTLEYTAKMHITALKNGVNMQGLSNETVHDFIHHSGYKPLRNWGK